MVNYLEGWKDQKEVVIPPGYMKGFKENIIIRKKIASIDNQETELPEKEKYSGDSPTVLMPARPEEGLYVNGIKTGDIIEMENGADEREG